MRSLARKCFSYLLSLSMLAATQIPFKSFGQISACPYNIGFEEGTFANWSCLKGNILRDGTLMLNPTAPVQGQHTVTTRTNPAGKDPYGNFPITCPNGSKYSIQLGNNGTGAGAEQVSYEFTIPPNQNDYSIIYNYAVVFQNPNHADHEQPRFTSRVFDITENKYIECGAFQFVASSSLPGFQLSTVGQNVYYKPWSPITIKLVGYAGKSIRLEFTNNDCTLGGHFGYAYLDVNENCTSPISGNVYCNGANEVVLNSPFGFQEYRWYNSDFTQLLGTSNTLTLRPPPPPNTVYHLEIVPYPGLGCLDTLTSVITLSNEAFHLNLVDSLQGCISPGIDLTRPNVTLGSTTGLTFSYFTDSLATSYVLDPQAVVDEGRYYIKGVNTVGCTEIKSLFARVRPAPNVVITPPAPVCAPLTINITTPATVAGSDAGLLYSYWNDMAATNALTNANTIATGGMYYIKGQDPVGCASIKPVEVSIGTSLQLVVSNPTNCGPVNLTATGIVAGSDVALQYAYFTDAAATQSITSPANITTSGQYFIKATNSFGCISVKPVQVTVNPVPAFVVTDPAPVIFPKTVSLLAAAPTNNNVVYTYWRNEFADIRVNQPAFIREPGTYFIKAENQFRCSTIKPVKVVITEPPPPKVIAPNAFSPNKDGINDLFKISIDGVVNTINLQLFNRWGNLVYSSNDVSRYWDGTFNSKPLPVGTYYWVYEGINVYDKKPLKSSGSVTLLR